MGLLLIDQLARSDNQAAIQLLLLFLVVLLFLSESGPGQVRSGPGTMHSMPCELISRMIFSRNNLVSAKFQRALSLCLRKKVVMEYVQVKLFQL